MKILNLYFKNINSLEGESQINFQAKPLANAGVFAIIGPNGSGKSSILDAISLALFGETFRFDRPAEHVMTRHTAESFSQLDFALGEDRFRSRWQVSRKDNHSKGELLDPVMKFFALKDTGEELLEESLQIVPERVEEIIGMDFQNFSRSIMLAQGDFAAFLNALDNERMDILEKMSSADIYDQHKQQLQTKKESAGKALKSIRDELNMLPVMSEAEAEACEHDLIDFKEQLDEYRQQQNGLKEQIAWARQVRSLEQQLSGVDKKRKLAEDQVTQTEKRLEKIESVAAVTAFSEDVETVEREKRQFAQSQKGLNSYKRELSQLQKSLQERGVDEKAMPQNGKDVAEQKKTIDELRFQVSQNKMAIQTETGAIQLIEKDIAEKKVGQEVTKDWLAKHEAEKSLLEEHPETEKLKQLRADLKNLEKQHKLVSKQLKAAETSLNKVKASTSQETKKITDLKESLVEAEKEFQEKEQEHTLAERQEMLEDQQQRVADFKELLALAKVNEKVSGSGLRGLFRSKNDDRPTLRQLQKKADELSGKIAEAQFLRDTLERAVANEAALKRMQQERELLEHGKPCPLCGSLDHPFAKQPLKESDSRQAFTDQNVKLQGLVSEADKLKKQMLATEKRNSAEEKKINSLQKNRSQWRILSNKLNVAGEDMDIENFSLMKGLLKKEEDELKELKKELKIFVQLQVEIETFKSQIETEEKKAETLKSSQLQLDDENETLPKTLAMVEKELEQMRADEKALTEKTMVQLELLGEKMPGKGQDSLLAERLKVREDEYRKYMLREQLAEKEIAALTENLERSKQKITQNETEMAQSSKELVVEESAGLHLSLIEKQKLIADREQSHRQQQQRMDEVNQALEDKLQDSPFASLSELKEALVLVSEKEAVEQKNASLKEQMDRLDHQQQQLQAKLEAEQQAEISKDSPEELEAKNRALAEKISIANAEIRTLSDRQRRQAGLKENETMLAEKLEQQQQHFEEAAESLKQSEESGAVFRRRVQLKMATELLSQANKILEKISGRYYIRQAPSDTGLALEIEDTKQQNSRRQPKSLSGGESFVVSLSLALALSELANNGKSVDSLFLDEGFGTLDSETLYTVVSTLQGLQTHGKTVGVISHVDGVRKRIKTRIEMVKKPNGLSQLKKVS